MDSSGIIAALAKMSRRRPEAIEGHLSLTSLGISSSFGLSALRSMIEAGSGTKLPVFTAQIKVDDLIGLATGGAVARTAPATLRPAASRPPIVKRAVGAVTRQPIQMPPVAGNFGLGMDMQDISVMPEVDDFRVDVFYSSHFSPAEIATASLRPSPRAHLCGLFCAKEALKKSHPDLLNLRMDEIAVVHDTTGRPLIVLADQVALPQDFRFLVSITHTAQMAAATCVTMWG